MHNGVQFDEQNTEGFMINRSAIVQKSRMVRLFESMGVPEKYVNVVMILISVLFFSISIFIIVKPPGSTVRKTATSNTTVNTN